MKRIKGFFSWVNSDEDRAELIYGLSGSLIVLPIIVILAIYFCFGAEGVKIASSSKTNLEGFKLYFFVFTYGLGVIAFFLPQPYAELFAELKREREEGRGQ